VVDDAEADAAATGLGAELSNDDARGHDGEQKWHLDDIRWRSHRAPTRGWTSLQEARPHCFLIRIHLDILDTGATRVDPHRYKR
jgi:hypothetical protein